MSDTLTTYTVTVATPEGTFDVDVPTGLGSEAAGRRAFFAIAAMFPHMDFDDIEVVDTVPVPQEVAS